MEEADSTDELACAGHKRWQANEVKILCYWVRNRQNIVALVDFGALCILLPALYVGKGLAIKISCVAIDFRWKYGSFPEALASVGVQLQLTIQ